MNISNYYSFIVKIICENYNQVIQNFQVIIQKDLKLYTVKVEFNPTVPHCSLATLIGLSIRIKVIRSVLENIKLDIYIKKGAHTTEEESNYFQLIYNKYNVQKLNTLTMIK